MCKICDHSNHQKIDAAIVRGVKNPTIFHEFINSGDREKWIQALKDHKRYGHVREKIQKAQDSKDIQQGLQLDTLLKETVDDLRDLADNAKHAEDYKAAASALGHIIRVAEILTKTNPDKPDRPYETMTDEELNAELTELLQSPKNQAS